MGVGQLNLKEIITKFKSSYEYKMMGYGEDYYRGDNTLICNRQKHYYDTMYEKLMCDPYKSNHKLPSGFFKKIVDQKVQYLLGNGLTSEHKDKLDQLTGDIDEYLVNMGTCASKQAVAWSYLYIDNGQKKVVQVPTEQLIAIYGNRNELILVIRFYQTTEILNGDFVELSKAELWDSETVQIWVKQNENGKEVYKLESEKYHVEKTINFNGAVISEEGNSFGYIPFIPMLNNREVQSDLKNIKDFIDIYDITNSDFANNIDDMQDAYYIIKNFQGQNLPEFLSQLKKDKVVQVGEDGAVESHQMEVPTEARSTFLKLVHDDIFEFSMSVDTKSLAGGSLTNVAIQSAYSDLDLKTDQFEMQVQKHLKRLLWIIDPNLEPDFVFERSLTMNLSERIKTLNESGVKISQRTLRANHPLVNDVDEEEALLKEEEESMMENFGFDQTLEDQEVEEGEE